jgi:LPPG:FO 2-phospho-L-lactate transferase
VQTDEGWLDFQEYFVHRHQGPEVRGVRFDGIEAARPTDAVLAALSDADLIVIGPSNPIVSLGPILAVPGLAEGVATARQAGVPVMTVSGIVGGKALKGPADRMLVSLGHASSAIGVAAILGKDTDTFVLDSIDAALEPAIAALGVGTYVTDTIMGDADGRARLAADLLERAAMQVPS